MPPTLEGHDYEPTGAPPQDDTSIKLKHGPCVVRIVPWERGGPTHEEVCREVGALTLMSSATVFELSDCAAGWSDYGPLTDVEMMPPGDQLPFSTTGGANLDRIDIDFPVLSVPELDPGSPARGEPWRLSWNPGDATAMRISAKAIITDSSVTFECVVPDTGQFDVPAIVVDEVLDAGSHANVTLTRRWAAREATPSGIVEFHHDRSRRTKVAVP